MKIQFLSDVHLERHANYSYLTRFPLQVKAEVLVIAGDLFPIKQLENFPDFLDFLSKNFKAVYWLPGNHEYYETDMLGYQAPFKIAVRSNIWLLDRQVVHLDDCELIFSTLWSKIPLSARSFVESHMPDFRFIDFGGRKFSVQDYNRLHCSAKTFIDQRLSSKAVSKRVVISHHIPTFLNYPWVFRNSRLNPAFAVELSKMIENKGPDFWIYGHHHQHVDPFMIGKTCILNNQLGYVDFSEHHHFRSVISADEDSSDVLLF